MCVGGGGGGEGDGKWEICMQFAVKRINASNIYVSLFSIVETCKQIQNRPTVVYCT